MKILFQNIIVNPRPEGIIPIADIEGKLSIELHGQVFFDEENILLFELFKSLKEWSNSIASDNVKNYVYESMDYEEEAIIEFFKNENNDEWSVHSVWERFSNNRKISFIDLIGAVDTAVKNFEKAILRMGYKL